MKPTANITLPRLNRCGEPRVEDALPERTRRGSLPRRQITMSGGGSKKIEQGRNPALNDAQLRDVTLRVVSYFCCCGSRRLRLLRRLVLAGALSSQDLDRMGFGTSRRVP